MNRLVKAFSNFKEFYSEINGATLTGAIDVIVVEQPDGEFQCSPFHVRFGKLGVLRSREKVVDIEINGEPVDIHMKLGESGEAFFVEEIAEDDGEEVPENMATSPIPTDYFPSKFTDDPTIEPISKPLDDDGHANEELILPIRRNSIDLSKENDENEAVFQNQVSSYGKRRHTDTTMERRNLDDKLKEYTTRKLREEWAEHEEMFQLDVGEAIKDANDITAPTTTKVEDKLESKVTAAAPEPSPADNVKGNEISIADKAKEDGKGKKKRKRKSQLKKREKNTQRKSSSSSSISSSTTPNDDAISITNNNNSSNEESQSLSVTTKSDELAMKTAENTIAADIKPSPMATPNRIPELDIHFFSDTEVGSGHQRGDRPSSPIQSDSELEMGLREKVNADKEISSASWKWGELPTQTDDLANQDTSEGQRNSMLSGMFSFMKRTNKLRKTSNDGGVYLSELDAEGMDPEMAALYFPTFNKDSSLCPGDDDRESGNGTSLPHSPSSLEGPKSIDSDYDDGKAPDKCLDFVSMSLSGGMEKGGPTDEEFDQNIIKYSDVCENPSLFSSPNLVVRLNGKYYSWSAACPIVMTIITFQKPLTNDAISQLMHVQSKSDDNGKQDKQSAQRRPYSSWWYWRRSGVPEEGLESKIKGEMVDNSTDPISNQTGGSNTPDEENTNNTISKTDTPLIADNTSAILDGDELSQSQNTTMDNSKSEKYKKSLRLSSEAIKKLNLKIGMNEIEFSVTTAYQGTSRCKCYLFRWKHNDKVVISDIDGTITKSDVLGHILPMVGKDWAQLGVAQLFSKIEENGYKLLYLSARAIGQSRVTREYLRSIRQGDVKLPDGPLLLNPTSLISAFHREVIERKPEEFKIACLSDIQALFPEKNPFYAGYGNRINDVWAYRAVGIPIMRIFTINTKGELKHELTQTFQSSYINQSLEVNEIFPYIQIIIDDDGSLNKPNDEANETDVLDDDDDDDELQFSCSSDNDEEYNVANDDVDNNNSPVVVGRKQN